MKALIVVLIVLAALLLLYGVVVILLGWQIFNFAVKRSRRSKAFKDDDYGNYKEAGRQRLKSLKADSYTILADDGVKLCGRYLHNEAAVNDNLLVAVHGFHCDGITELAGQSGYWLARGFDLFVTDNRGHGQSEGRYIGFGTLDARDLKLWLRFIASRFPGKHIYLLGVSMGCTTVLNACDDLPAAVAGIVADCGFTSVAEQLKNVLGSFGAIRGPAVRFASFLCRKKAGYGFYDENTLRHVINAAAPIIFIHGGADSYVPTYMTKLNFEACNARKTLLIVPGATHPRSHFVAPQLYERSVDEFFHLNEKDKDNEKI